MSNETDDLEQKEESVQNTEQAGECDHDCENCSEQCDESTVDFRVKLNEMSTVKKVIAVISGKGGVGKSMVTSMLAVAMRRLEYKTAILDADLTGPSIPKAFGIREKCKESDFGIIPGESKTGIKVMSINLLIPDETDPIVWRGPLIAGTVKQFWSDVVWGDIDVLFVDMPPGTGDVPLTVFQSLPVDGIIIVSSPQELVSMIVEKSVKMAEMMNIPILGIVENMSYATCPKCHEKIDIFGGNKIEEVAKKHHLSVCAKIPIDPIIASAMDRGLIELVHDEEFVEIIQKIEALGA